MEQNYKNVFSYLRQQGIEISPELEKNIAARLDEVLSYTPKIGVFGKTGSGKSSLCNALFGKDVCEISDVEACTRNTQDVLIKLSDQGGITLLDVPGVGENSERDVEYGELYAKLLPELDAVLWLIKADDRALSSDEAFFKQLVKPHIAQHKPFFFVLSQSDKMDPIREWDDEKHEPGAKQLQNIERKRGVLADFFGVPKSKVVAVSAEEKYNLVTLLNEILYALPAERCITYYSGLTEEFKNQVDHTYVKEATESVFEKIFDSIADFVGEKIPVIVDGIYEVVKNVPVIGPVVSVIKGFFDLFS